MRLAPGDAAPDFELLDADERPISLMSLRGQRAVLYFYPAALTPGCTTQACDFRDNLDVLRGAGAVVADARVDGVGDRHVAPGAASPLTRVRRQPARGVVAARGDERPAREPTGRDRVTNALTQQRRALAGRVPHHDEAGADQRRR